MMREAAKEGVGYGFMQQAIELEWRHYETIQGRSADGAVYGPIQQDRQRQCIEALEQRVELLRALDPEPKAPTYLKLASVDRVIFPSYHRELSDAELGAFVVCDPVEGRFRVGVPSPFARAVVEAQEQSDRVYLQMVVRVKTEEQFREERKRDAGTKG